MRAVVQRVSQARVEVNGKEIALIGPGILILLGVAPGDAPPVALRLAERLAHLRIFDDAAGKMNLSLLDVGGEALVVSQFTLYGDCRKGRRPSFSGAAEPSRAEELYRIFCRALQDITGKTRQGEFGALMLVSLKNDGPVTLIVEE